MRKYFSLAKITFQEYFVYRLNFVLWRFRSFVVALIMFFFWTAIYQTRGELFGYQRNQMLTYILGLIFLRSFVLASRTAGLAGRIKSGSLVKDLLRPWSIFKFFITRDLVDKLLNFGFAILEIFLILHFFKFSFYLPRNPLTFLVFGLVCLLSLSLYFLISFWLATFTFWIDQPWAPRFLFDVIFLQSLSGGIFPLDILPDWVAKISSFTPFPYLIYFPLKIWLEQVESGQLIKVIMLTIFWLALFWWITKKTWEKGLKNYSVYGG